MYMNIHVFGKEEFPFSFVVYCDSKVFFILISLFVIIDFCVFPLKFAFILGQETHSVG